MVKLGKVVPTEYQTCYSHRIHFEKCCTRSLLKKSKSIHSKKQTTRMKSVAISLILTQVSILGAVLDENIPIPKVKVQLQSVITKVRKIDKLFRKSPVKNDVLQEEIKK